MKRANPLSRAARLAKTRREQEEARREREKLFPKPKLVTEIERTGGDQDDGSERPRRALTATTRGSNASKTLHWRVPGVIPTSSWESVILAFVPATRGTPTQRA